MGSLSLILINISQDIDIVLNETYVQHVQLFPIQKMKAVISFVLETLN